VCFQSRRIAFEAKFYENSIVHSHPPFYSRSVRSQSGTNTTSSKCTEKKTHTLPCNKTPLGSMIHKWRSSRYLSAHNCITGGFRAEFKFWELLRSTSCGPYNPRNIFDHRQFLNWPVEGFTKTMLLFCDSLPDHLCCCLVKG